MWDMDLLYYTWCEIVVYTILYGLGDLRVVGF